MPKRKLSSSSFEKTANARPVKKRARKAAVVIDAFNFASLPSEIQHRIWHYLDDRSQNNLHLVCRTWRKVCKLHFPLKLAGTLQLSIDHEKCTKTGLIKVTRGNFDWNRHYCNFESSRRRVKYFTMLKLPEFLDTITFSTSTVKPSKCRPSRVGFEWIRDGGTLDLELNMQSEQLDATNRLLGILAQCKKNLQPKSLSIMGLPNSSNFLPALEKLQSNGNGLERISVLVRNMRKTNPYKVHWRSKTCSGDFSVVLNDRILLPTLTQLFIYPTMDSGWYTAKRFLEFIRLDQQLKIRQCVNANLQWLKAAVQQWRVLACQFNQPDSAERMQLARNREPSASWTFSIVFTKDYGDVAEAFRLQPVEVDRRLAGSFCQTATWRFVEGECKLKMKLLFDC